MDNRQWFYERKWGLFSHFHSFQNSNERTGFRTYEDYNERVNSFDVEQYARTAHEVNAGYVVFTIMQGDIYMCAPNETFNKITGYKTGEACSERDLIADLITALDKYDIPLFLYFTGDGPYKDEKAGKAFGYYDRENELVSMEFVRKWSSVMKEYAVRYGKKVRGWWLDGMYPYFGNNDELLKLYADAAKAGNPDALIAFNNGVVKPDYTNPKYEKYYNGETHPLKQVRILEKLAMEGNKEVKECFITPPTARYSVHENYTAGEANDFEELPTGRFCDGAQWHRLSFLGKCKYFDPLWGNAGWNNTGLSYDADYMYEYVKKCNELGGVISIDAYLFDNGTIDKEHYEVLKRLGELRKE